MIGIIDYGMGNLRSVEKALQQVGAQTIFVKSQDQVSGLNGLVLPGVGAFGDCVQNLRNTGLWNFLCDWIAADKPFFGICLGYQMLFKESEEAPGVAGLGIFPGKVVKFEENRLKVPQIGWNQIEIKQSSPFLEGIQPGDYVYFVHSFYPSGLDPSLVALTTEYGVSFASAIVRGNLFATQFHPEKSQKVGLRLLRNFVGTVNRLA